MNIQKEYYGLSLIRELKIDMKSTLELACNKGFNDYIDRNVIQEWVDALEKIIDFYNRR